MDGCGHGWEGRCGRGCKWENGCMHACACMLDASVRLSNPPKKSLHAKCRAPTTRDSTYTTCT